MAFGRRTQSVVCWERAGTDEYGEPTVSDPISLTVRWERGLAQEIRPSSNPTAIDATLWVDRDLEIGSMVRIGSLLDLPGTADEILEVVEMQTIPDIKGRAYERVALCRRYRDMLPTVED